MDARADGMPAPMLAERKRELVNQVGADRSKYDSIAESSPGPYSCVLSPSAPVLSVPPSLLPSASTSLSPEEDLDPPFFYFIFSASIAHHFILPSPFSR